MRSLLSAIACWAGIAAAVSFRDTSPFLLFSTSEILVSPPQIITAKSLTSTLEHELSKCPSDTYVLVHQPGVNADDFSGSPPVTFPEMLRLYTGGDNRVRSSFSVGQVIGHVSQGALRELLEDRCGAGSMHLDARTGLYDLVDEQRPRVITVAMNELPQDAGRLPAAHVNELYLKSMLDMLPTSNFTVVLTTTPPGEAAANANTEQEDVGTLQYEMDHTDGYAHMELRRSLSGGVGSRASKGDDDKDSATAKAPLFEKYQFFTPALFMGGSVMLLLAAIMFVAVRAIAGMQVTYAAFEKESGPQSQRKQQ